MIGVLSIRGWPCGQDPGPSRNATNGAVSCATRRKAWVTGFDRGNPRARSPSRTTAYPTAFSQLNAPLSRMSQRWPQPSGLFKRISCRDNRMSGCHYWHPRESVGESCDGSSSASPRPRGGRGAGGRSGGGRDPVLWSLRRLWEAAIRRLSDRIAALPLRCKRSIRRLPAAATRPSAPRGSRRWVGNAIEVICPALGSERSRGDTRRPSSGPCATQAL